MYAYGVVGVVVEVTVVVGEFVVVGATGVTTVPGVLNPEVPLYLKNFLIKFIN